MRTPSQKFWIIPLSISIVLLAVIGYWQGFSALLTASLLAVLEITLSFDNAIINAKVLSDMSRTWQNRFLTWGMLFSVVGTRLVLPILIVSAVAYLSPITVFNLALFNSSEYGVLLAHSHYAISAFGTAFLAMVALTYFFNEQKDDHWIEGLEKHLSGWGSIQEIEVALVLGMLLTVGWISGAHQATILVAGSIGIILFIAMEGLTHTMKKGVQGRAAAGLAGFIYLNVLDSAFSLDGVIGAFAITSNIVAIAAGLGIGAYAVRMMTVYFVQEGTLGALKYLEHGAHWAILALAVSMAASIVVEVPEAFTALIGIILISGSYLSSRRARSV